MKKLSKIVCQRCLQDNGIEVHNAFEILWEKNRTFCVFSSLSSFDLPFGIKITTDTILENKWLQSFVISCDEIPEKCPYKFEHIIISQPEEKIS